MPELLTRQSRLRLGLEICLLALVAATALGYPLFLGDDQLKAIIQHFGNPKLSQQLIPWLSGGYSPLVLKENILLTLVLALLFIFAWLKIRGQWLGQERSAFADGKGLKGLLLKPESWILALLFYGAASVAWSPVFQQSLQTWVVMAAGMSVVLIARSEARGSRFVIRFMLITIACGLVLAVLALLQHLGYYAFLPSNSDPRNRMSSLIGHNTGLSAWLLFPLSFSLYFLLTNRRLWVKLACVAFTLLIVLVIIAAQSRAIWALGLIMLVILPWKICSVYRRRVRAVALLTGVAAVIAIVAALSFSPQTNPLARLPVSLEQRLSGDIFNVDQLRRETRVRILVVGLTGIFPGAPILGTGLGSFSWEYPKAQGTFFTTHPDTWLGTTTRRTDLAHNDYLQWLLETGLLGLLLLAGAIVTVARELRRCYQTLPAPWHRAKWWALTFPSAAVAAQALVDFPFHVAPIAVVTLVSMTLATRIEDTPAELSVTAISPESRGRATSVSLLITIVLFSWAPWGWQALVGRVLVSDCYYNMGLHALDDYLDSDGQTIQHRLAMLDRSRQAFREAIINNVFNGEAYEGQATAYANRAGLALQHFQEIRSTAADNSTTEPELFRTMIDRDADSAIAATENQLRAGGLRYHYTYYLMGRAWRTKWELEKLTTKSNPEESTNYSNAISALKTSLEYNPSDAASIRELSDLLIQSPATAEEGRQLRNRLFKLDPWSADELILQPAVEHAANGDLATAKEMLGGIFDDLPHDPRVLAAKAWLAYYEAVWPPEALDALPRAEEYLQWRRQHLDAGWDAVKALPETKYFKPIKQRLSLLYAAASGDLQRAFDLSSAAVSRDIWNREARAINYWTAHELHGGGLKYEDSIPYYRTKALLSLYFMTDRQMGLALGELTFRKKLTLPEARRLVAFCRANETWELLAKILPQIRKDYPGDPVLQRTADEVSRHLDKNAQ